MSKRYRNYDHARTCEACGDTFHASRYDAKFCSSACRSRYNRQSVLRSQRIERIKEMLDAVLTDESLETRDTLIAELDAYMSVYTVKVIG